MYRWKPEDEYGKLEIKVESGQWLAVRNRNFWVEDVDRWRVILKEHM